MSCPLKNKILSYQKKIYILYRIYLTSLLPVTTPVLDTEPSVKISINLSYFFDIFETSWVDPLDYILITRKDFLPSIYLLLGIICFSFMFKGSRMIYLIKRLTVRLIWSSTVIVRIWGSHIIIRMLEGLSFTFHKSCLFHNLKNMCYDLSFLIPYCGCLVDLISVFPVVDTLGFHDEGRFYGEERSLLYISKSPV